LSLSAYYERIICADIASENLAAIRKWLEKDPSAHSWDALIRFCASLENKITAGQMESRVRQRIVDVLQCDVLKEVPMDGYLEKADAVVSNLCLGAACNSVEQYRQAFILC
jgi:hypothetical protein